MPIRSVPARALGVLALTAAAPLAAATYTVNTAADAGAGSLRSAINLANGNPGADTINIAIGSGLRTITLASALPTITDAVTLDASTQPGYAGVPLIQLSGASAPDGVNGFVVATNGVTIKGFSIIRFKDSGIVISGSGNVVRNCYIGLDGAGAAAGNADVGVFATGSSNQIFLNVVAANGVDGIRIDQSGSVDNLIHSNWIGTNPGGTVAMGNSLNGIVLSGARNTRVGGVGSGNIISGNGRNGIAITAGATGTLVIRNHIGVSAAGNAALGNAWDGVVIVDSPGNAIGGNAEGEYNVISANGGDGIEIRGAAATGNIVQRGVIGTSAGGTIDLGNGGHGVHVQSSGNQIGTGPYGAGGSLISGNDGDGVRLTSSGNTVRGNRIGTDKDGLVTIPNARGVYLNDWARNSIIGTPDAGNLISGNAGHGIQVEALGGVDGLVVQGNRIGTNAPGTGPLGNAGAGIQLLGATASRVGGPDAGQGNRIAANAGDGLLASVADSDANVLVQGNAFGIGVDGAHLGNGGAGIRVTSSGSVGGGVAILSNQMATNGGLGIDLHAIGALPNDSGDGDSGPNGLQNHPLIAAAIEAGGTTSLNGTFNSRPDRSYRLEFYANGACDPSGHGEGAGHVATLDVSTDASGNAAFSVPVNGWPVGTVFSATATSNGALTETSEFSPCAVSYSIPALIEFQQATSSAAETAGTVGVTLTRGGDTTTAVSVRVDSVDEHYAATAGVDYQAIVGHVVSFAPGQTTATVNLVLLDDNVFEGNESLRLVLSNPSAGATVGSVNPHRFTIGSDDPQPTISLDNGGCTVTEGNSGNRSCNFVLRLSNPSYLQVYFRTSAAGRSASENADFTPHTEIERSIDSGQTSVVVAVPVLGDLVDEDNESFNFSVRLIGNAAPGELNGTGTILDDDAAPTLSVDNGGCSLTEGNAGSANCGFVLRLSAPSSRLVRASTALANGSATQGRDFGGIAPYYDFPPGSTSVTVNVPVIADDRYEYDETYTLQVSNVMNATPASLSGSGNILNDDAAPGYTLSPCAEAEGDDGLTPCVIRASLAQAAERPLHFAYWSESGEYGFEDNSFEVPYVASGFRTLLANEVLFAWVVASGSVDLIAPNFWSPADYRQSIDLNGGSPGAIYRDIDIPAGEVFRVSFAMSGNAACGAAVKTLQVHYGDQLVGEFSFDSTGATPANMRWTYQQVSATGRAETTPLRFTSTTPGACGPVIDNVVISLGGQATSGIDYRAPFATPESPLVVAAGTTAFDVPIQMIGDNQLEGDERTMIQVCTLDGPMTCRDTNAFIVDDEPRSNEILADGFETPY